MAKALNLSNQHFGRLKVIERAKNDSHGKTMWLCECDCGNVVVVSGSHLLSGHTKSCGCISREFIQSHPTITHGLTKEGDKKSRLYRIWSGMKNRCNNPNDKDHFEFYGAKGVEVCDEWKRDYKAFYDWALANGYRNNLTIDRIDPFGNYEPSNCRWATAQEQANNKRNSIIVQFNGKHLPLKEVSKISGIGYPTLYYRHKHNIALVD